VKIVFEVGGTRVEVGSVGTWNTGAMGHSCLLGTLDWTSTVM
jgi:hypothetical protein